MQGNLRIVLLCVCVIVYVKCIICEDIVLEEKPERTEENERRDTKGFVPGRFIYIENLVKKQVLYFFNSVVGRENLMVMNCVLCLEVARKSVERIGIYVFCIPRSLHYNVFRENLLYKL